MAYLCDAEKGGRTVTANALQENSSENVLWLAANEGISDGILTYVESLVKQLKEITADNRKSIEKKVFGAAVECASQRISFYQLRLVNYAEKC